MKVVFITDDILIDRRIIHESKTIKEEFNCDVKIFSSYLKFHPFTLDSDIKNIEIDRILIEDSFENDFLSVFEVRSIESIYSLLKIAFKTNLTLFKFYIKNTFIKNIIIKIIKNIKSKAKYTLGKIDEKYLEKLKNFQPDIIHVHDLTKLGVAYHYKKLFPNIKIIYDVHELFGDQPGFTTKEKKNYDLIEKKLIQSADKIITVNNYLSEIIKEKYKLKEVVVVHNSTEIPDCFDIKNNYDLFRKKFNLKNDNILILYQGNFTEYRKLKDVIIGLKLSQRKDVFLVFLGSGYYETKMKELIRKFKLEDNCFIHPRVSQEELLYYTASADIGLIPYSYKKDLNTLYCSPNKFYEFIAAGIPILSNKLPFIEYNINRNGIGYIFDIESPYKFSEALNSIKKEDIKIKKEKVLMYREYYLWENEKKNLVELYKGLIIK